MKTLRISKILISSVMMLLAIVMMASATSAWLVIEGTVGNRQIGSYKHADGADIKAAGENGNEPGNLEQSALDADSDHTSNAATPTSLEDRTSNAATLTSLAGQTNNEEMQINPGEVTAVTETTVNHDFTAEETMIGSETLQ
jgi:hypothetical protein